MVKHDLKLDLLQCGNQGCLYVKRTDKKSRQLNVLLTVDGTPYKVSGDAQIRARLPDGTFSVWDCTANDTIQWTVAEMLLEGEATCQIKITDGDAVIYSPQFDIIVEGVL